MKKKKIFNIVLLLVFTLVLTGCEDTNSKYEVSNCIACGDTYFPENVALLSANVINLIKILVPVFIIILGMIELFKAVIAGDEKKMDESKGSLIKKFIAGITIFLVIAIVQFVFGLYDDANDDGSDSLECLKYFVVKDAAKDQGVSCPDRTENSEGKSVKEKNDYKIKLKDGGYVEGKDNGGNGDNNDKPKEPEKPIQERQAEKNCTQKETESSCQPENGSCKWYYNGSKYACTYARNEYVTNCANRSSDDCTKLKYCTVKYDGSTKSCVYKY